MEDLHLLLLNLNFSTKENKKQASEFLLTSYKLMIKTGINKT